MAKTQRDVIPILDIQSAEFAEQYQLGAYWARYGDEQGNGPQPDMYSFSTSLTLSKAAISTTYKAPGSPILGFSWEWFTAAC